MDMRQTKSSIALFRAALGNLAGRENAPEGVAYTIVHFFVGVDEFLYSDARTAPQFLINMRTAIITCRQELFCLFLDISHAN
jgi:hypothetical protein